MSSEPAREVLQEPAVTLTINGTTTGPLTVPLAETVTLSWDDSQVSFVYIYPDSTCSTPVQEYLSGANPYPLAATAIVLIWGPTVSFQAHLRTNDSIRSECRAVTVDTTPASSPTAMPTNTPLPTATNTLAPTATNTVEPTATNTAVPTATNTVAPTATNTVAPTATNTAVPTATNTAVPTATNTAVPTATNTTVPIATSTVVPTSPTTPEPTATDIPASTAEPSAEPSATTVPTSTSTVPAETSAGLVTLVTSDGGTIPDGAIVCVGDVCQTVGAGVSAAAASGTTLTFADLTLGTYPIAVTNAAPYADAVGEIVVAAGSTSITIELVIQTSPTEPGAATPVATVTTQPTFPEGGGPGSGATVTSLPNTGTGAGSANAAFTLLFGASLIVLLAGTVAWRKRFPR